MFGKVAFRIPGFRLNNGQGVKKNSRVVEWNRKATEQDHVYIILTAGLKTLRMKIAKRRKKILYFRKSPVLNCIDMVHILD